MLLFLLVSSLELIPPNSRTPSDQHLLNLRYCEEENNLVQLILAEVNHFSSICPGVTSLYGRFLTIVSLDFVGVFFS